jgi:hypothetical protein
MNSLSSLKDGDRLRHLALRQQSLTFIDQAKIRG